MAAPVRVHIFRDDDENGVNDGWHWVNDEGLIPSSNGNPAGYANWLTGEPNDNFGPGSEQFLAINLLGQWGWNDEGNVDLIAGFVVEYDDFDEMAPIPAPATLLLVLMGLGGLARLRTQR